MKVSKIELNNFKRFTHLTISGIPNTCKLVIVVGPNGSGKSSLFDAFNSWYRQNSGFGHDQDDKYYRKELDKAFQLNKSVTLSFHDHQQGKSVDRSAMYFRTAYRNDPDFNVTSIKRVDSPQNTSRISRLIDNDQAVSENFQRLTYSTVTGVYNEGNDAKTVKELREELIGKVRESMAKVFEELILNNIGDPLSDGCFFFKKGNVNSYHYKNLSGGEKAAFDLLLDLIIKLSNYRNTVFFIDEPELHMHTDLQGRLIDEIYRLIPDNCQMWINTHSLGVMRKAKELSQANPNTVTFIDFGEADFDSEVEINPASIDGITWEKYLSIALGDFKSDLNPECLVICEGDFNGKKRKDFDSYLYAKIFNSKYPQITFISGGSCNEIESDDHMGFNLLKQVLKGTKIFRLVDRDDKSPTEVDELLRKGILVTNRRHLEAYLWDDEIITKLANKLGKQSLLPQALAFKQSAIASSISRGNAHDDLKSASGEIYTNLKQLFQLTKCGNTPDAFMRDSLAVLLTDETNVYKEMEESLITKIKI
jgi:predicted ATPase